MSELLVLWGVAQAAGFVFKPILEELAKDAAKDFTKDFFKDALKKVIHLPEKDVQKEAYGKALKEFLELMQKELEGAGCQEARIKQYIPALKKFIANQEVIAALGMAFNVECKAIDTSLLVKSWAELKSPLLPEDFDWDFLSKSYIRKVKSIVQSSEKLRPIFEVQIQEQIADGIQELKGIPPEFDLRKYAEGLKERYGNLKLESLNTDGCAYNALKLWRMFVPQQVRECQEFMPQVYELPKDRSRLLQEAGQLDVLAIREGELEDYRQRYREQPIKPIFEVVGNPQIGGKQGTAKYAVILGDPGSGKSTLLQYLALIWAERPVRDLPLQPLPLLLELRTYARDKKEGRCKDIVSFIHEGNITCRLNQQELHAKLKKGDVVALFDGIDEVFDPELREVVVTDIHRFTNEYPLVRVVATSRWLGYKAQKLRDAEFQHFMLQDLDDEQIKDFLRRWHDLTFAEGQEKEQKREWLQKAIRESKSIHELAGNPLLLTMMAILNRNQELPRDRPELYNQASRVLLHQWDVERALVEDSRIDPKIIDYRDKQAILRKVAHYMQSSAKGLAGNLISGEQLEGILIDYLRTIDIEKPREIARVMINQLRTRNFILCDLGANSYGFVHRTFLEYFCAWEFVWQFKEDQTLLIEQLIQDVFGNHWQDESWHEVLRLICGMIEPKFVAEIIAFLLEKKVDRSKFLDEDDTSKRLKKEGISNLLLATNCFGEVRNRNSITTISNKLLEILKQEIDQQSPYKFCWETISITIDLIAQNWKENPDILTWFKDRTLNTQHSGVAIKAVEVIAQYWKEVPETLIWLKERALNDPYEFVRETAVKAITQYWQEVPETLIWLKEYAINDPHESVRKAAVEAMAQYWQEVPETLIWLKEYAINDQHVFVRRIAVYKIAQYWKDELEILLWLKECALYDKDDDVRIFAVCGITQYLQKDTETLIWLKERALNDQNYLLRGIALDAIAKYWNEDLEIFEFLYDRTLNDSFISEENWNLFNPRKIALKAILEYYKDNPQTLELLNHVINNDPAEYLKEFAQQELAKLSK
jgi:predicted NACHT family NTPase/HEAT repeat protein